MRANILIAGVVLVLVAAGVAAGLLWPIAADSRAPFCTALANGSEWAREECLRSDEIADMLQQVDHFCDGNSDHQQCLDSQKQALIQIVRTSESHPLETNQKLADCLASSRNALGRTDFVKASSCLDNATRNKS